MKFGMRKPSLKKSIKARTTGKLKRKVKKAIIPGYGKKGMGWIRDPKKAAYNKVYNKTTFGVNDVIKAASSTKSKPRANPKSNSKSNAKSNQRYSSNSNLWQGVKELKNELGINTKGKDRPAYYIYGGLLCIILGFGNPLLLLIGFVLEILGLISMCKKSYWDAYRWHKAIEMYKRGNYEKSKVYLNKLSHLEKEIHAYGKMLDLLGDNNKNLIIDKRTTEGTVNEDVLQKKEISKISKVSYSVEVFDEFIVVDTETTGLDSTCDKIIEISALKYREGNIVDKFETLINPEIHIPSYITEINNINDEMVKDKPIIADVLNEFLKFIGDTPLVAHNASFDMKFLNANLALMDKVITNKVIDTLKISREIYPDLPNHKLSTIKEHLSLDLQSHRASADCIVAAQIYINYCKIKDDEVISESSVELELYNKVKEILKNNNRNIEYLKLKHTGVYTDICTFYILIRAKLNGKKQYILTNIDEEILTGLGFALEKPSKSENYKNRIKFTSIDIVERLESYIIEEFDRCMNSLET